MAVEISRKRRRIVPEVVQTSAMDCGPAVLKCLLEGFGIHADYGRLREACQTDIDGTSIDVLEQLACQLGLAAEQVMVPVDHLLLAEAECLPAILVVRLPNGFTHFKLIWNRHGRWVQVMDPAEGRRWLTCREVLDEAYLHTHRHPAEGWRAWAASSENRRPLVRRMCNLGVAHGAACQIFDQAAANADWRQLAAVDAATRMIAALVDAGGVRRGREAHSLLASLIQQASADWSRASQVICDQFWTVVAAPAPTGGDEEASPSKDEEVLVRGAVLVRVLGRTQEAGNEPAAESISPEIAAAVAAPPLAPMRRLFGLLRGAGAMPMAWLLVGLFLAAGCTVFEALLLRGAIGIGRDLGPMEQRLAAAAAFAGFIALTMLLELAVMSSWFRLGRRIELGLRTAFLEKLPCLVDRYFQSRPISDMAERSHAIYQVRLLPELAGRFLRTTMTLFLTAGAIAWIDPMTGLLAGAAALVAMAVPLAFNGFLQGIDVRLRTHTAALSRFYLDALLGLTAVRLHGGERALSREHESLLVQWVIAHRQFVRWVVIMEGVQIFIGFSMAAALILLHAGRVADFGAMLVLAYWALHLPTLAEEVVHQSQQYPMHRNLILRLLEPLGAPVEARQPGGSPENPATPDDEPGGVSLSFASVDVHAAGHAILADVSLQIASGSHVAIVGPSGAGKSSLVGLLLGWHRAAAGQVLVEGEPLDARRLQWLRERTAWVDPAVQLWNRSLLANLQYGGGSAALAEMGQALHDAELYDVLERLPDGLQSALGEGGGLVSGGEGQRVRFGRALLRSNTRLAILDEPFRGLSREQRREMLARARQQWRSATLLCITHDVRETCDFQRVLVIDGGRVVEDGAPAELASLPGSRYRQLLEAEDAVRSGLWEDSVWRRWQLAGGQLQNDGAALQ